MNMVRWLLALVLLAAAMAPAHAQDFPRRGTEPVVDAAGLLSADQKAEITRLSEAINKTTTRQFVVATIPDLQGYEISDYGYQLGRHWGLGQKEANNGILLIVAPKERKVRIEVGYGLEPIMTDALSGMIINDTILPRFKAGDMGGGIVAGAQAIGAQMQLPLEAAEERARAAAEKTVERRAERRRSGGGFPVSLVFWGVIFMFVLLPMIGLGFRRRRGPWGGRRYRGGDGNGMLPILLWGLANEIGRSRGGGGGWSGGSSGWGGGGGGWSGGGGGFSGGGGSFGGGGASGSW